jgi:hypothetical protein
MWDVQRCELYSSGCLHPAAFRLIPSLAELSHGECEFLVDWGMEIRYDPCKVSAENVVLCFCFLPCSSVRCDEKPLKRVVHWIRDMVSGLHYSDPPGRIVTFRRRLAIGDARHAVKRCC